MSGGARPARLALLMSLAGLAAVPAGAQRYQPEARVDLIGPSPHSPQAGLGVTAAAGSYTRVSAVVGYGPRRRAAAVTGGEWRTDLVARVTLDPFRQQRWALAFGGGLSIRRSAYLAILADLEGAERAGWLPVFQVGVSGGWRAGLILRRAVAGRR